MSLVVQKRKTVVVAAAAAAEGLQGQEQEQEQGEVQEQAVLAEMLESGLDSCSWSEQSAEEPALANRSRNRLIDHPILLTKPVVLLLDESGISYLVIRIQVVWCHWCASYWLNSALSAVRICQTCLRSRVGRLATIH